MADAVLGRLSACNIFDLSGVVAVVTGGGTVWFFIPSYSSGSLADGILRIGHWTDDNHDLGR